METRVTLQLWADFGARRLRDGDRVYEGVKRIKFGEFEIDLEPGTEIVLTAPFDAEVKMTGDAIRFVTEERPA